MPPDGCAKIGKQTGKRELRLPARESLRIRCQVTDGSQRLRDRLGAPGCWLSMTSAITSSIGGSGPACHHQNGLSDESRFLCGGAQYLAVVGISDVRAIPMNALEHRDHVDRRVGGNGLDGARMRSW